MASLTNGSNGTRTVQFVGPDRKRRSIRLGKVSKKLAESVKLKVEHLAAAAASRLPLDLDTANWVAGVGAELHGKFAAVGLVPKRESAALGPFLADYVARRRADGTKGSTVRIIDQVVTDLVNALGGGTDLRSVTAAAADDFVAHYAGRDLANATVVNRLRVCKMVFDNAVRRGLADRNPFADAKAPAGGPNASRQHYVTRDAVRRVIAVCSPEWQTVAALSRFGGLRCPTEVFSLRVADVDLAAGRMTVLSPKTERHPGGASRVVPIFPDLRPYLQAACERAAAAGSAHVVNGAGELGRRRAATHPDGWSAVTAGSMFAKMVRRAGLAAWPRITHNMRASCETDLMQDHPIHVVCAWIGNTPKVALQHYLQTIDSDFAKAIAGPASGGAESGAQVVQNAVLSPAAGGCQGVPNTPTPGGGFTANRGKKPAKRRAAARPPAPAGLG